MKKMHAIDYKKLIEVVTEAGNQAQEMQHSITRGKKGDGSVITEADLMVNTMITNYITSNHPNDILISEESDLMGATLAQAKALTCSKASHIQGGNTCQTPYIFVLDPIDGTDAFSQGMQGWCVALGVLNAQREPIGSIVYAPSFNTLFTSLEGHTACIQGQPLVVEPQDMENPGLMAGSRVHAHFDLGAYPYKIRNIGSNILHTLAPLLYSNIGGSLIHGCFVWDIAPAHHFLLQAGQRIMPLHTATATTLTDPTLTYHSDPFLLEKSPLPQAYITGSAEYCQFARNYIVPR